MELYEALEEINGIAEKVIAGMTQTSAGDMGMDPRAGYRLYVSDDGIAVAQHNIGSLEYYGGFEYVDSDNQFMIGSYKFYSADNERVSEAIDTWEMSK